MCLRFPTTPQRKNTPRRDQDQLVAATYIQTRQQMLSPTENFARANEFMNRILDRLVDVAIGTTHDLGQEYRSWI